MERAPALVIILDRAFRRIGRERELQPDGRIVAPCGDRGGEIAGRRVRIVGSRRHAVGEELVGGLALDVGGAGLAHGSADAHGVAVEIDPAEALGGNRERLRRGGRRLGGLSTRGAHAADQDTDDEIEPPHDRSLRPDAPGARP